MLVLSGDVPLVSAEVISELLAAHGRERGLGDGDDRDPRGPRRPTAGSSGTATARSRRSSRPRRPATRPRPNWRSRRSTPAPTSSRASSLATALGEVSSDNAQGEYYLPDVLAIMRSRGERVSAHIAEDTAVNLGINNRVDLATVEAEARQRILERHMLAGVTIVDPATTWIDADVIDRRGCPDRARYLAAGGDRDRSRDAVIGPHSTIIDSGIGDRSQVLQSHLVLCEVMEDCQVGPFAYLRPGAQLEDGSKAGTFVEIKNSVIGSRRQGAAPLLHR